MDIFADEDEEAISPLPSPPSVGADKTELGAYLYRDPGFSENYSFSCNNCHSLKKSGIDQLPIYVGINGTKGNLNTPTTLNAKLNFRQFWNGRAQDFSQAIDDHIADKTIFSNDWEKILKRLQNNDMYVDLFKLNYENGKIDSVNVKDALINFLNNLVTPKSAFDQYLNGNRSAISPDAKKGFDLFKQYGCVTCHQGANIGGNLLEKLGVYKDYYLPSESNPANVGLYTVTKNKEDLFVFKVPSLRNITLTGPYLHDGSIKTLEEMIELMGVYQVGQNIPKEDIQYIIKFFETLNGNQEYK